MLDSLLESLINNFKNLDYPIHLIYHEDISHSESYKILFSKYKNYIHLHTRETFFLNKLSLLRPLNLLWYLKFSWIRSYYDNFKNILDSILYDSKVRYILLSTDDQIFYKKKNISKNIFDIINKNPKSYSYRLNVNDYFDDEHQIRDTYEIKVNKIEHEKILEWNSSKIKSNNLWSYNFNVDGTIYECNSLYNLISPFIYNMPTTLESIGLWESRFRKYYWKCMSDTNRSMIGVQANNIQTTNDTPQANFDLNLLSKLYMEGYNIDYEKYDINEKKYIFVPKFIPLKKNGKVYYLTEDGKLS